MMSFTCHIIHYDTSQYREGPPSSLPTQSPSHPPYSTGLRVLHDYSFRPISLLCHTYTLFEVERLILNRMTAHVDKTLIAEQEGFRPGRSWTSRPEHIDDGYENRQITGAVFVDLSAAYDTVNHRRLLCKVSEMTGDLHK